MRLDARTVAALTLPAGKRDVIYFCSDLSGFGVRIRQGGQRTYVVQYRANGRTRRIKLGSADVLTVEAARRAAKVVLARALTGSDPQAERRREREAARVTLRSIVESYLSSREGKTRPKTAKEVRRYLTGFYFRPLHAMPIASIDRRAIASCILDIERESGTVTASRARSALSSLFSWAVTTGLAESTPLVGTYKPPAQPARDRVLTDGELAAIWRASGDGDFGAIVRLLVLTASRRAEIGGMCWPELDREAGTWCLPASRSKNHRTHTLALPAAAWQIIDSVPHVIGRDYLFGRRGFTGWYLSKRALDTHLGDAVKPWTLHDLRRSVATGMATNLGTPPHVIEAVLNHQSGHRAGTAGVYNRSSYQREVAAALALWASRVAEMVDGGERKILVMREKT